VYSDGAGSGASVVDAFQDVALGGTPTATNMTITSSLTADAVISTTSVKTPLIEYTDGDDAMTIADGGAVTFAKSIGVGTTASATTGEIRATNNITAYYSSDIGLKENLNPIENSIEKIQAISGYNFDWKDEVVKERGGEDDYFVRKSDVGVVAQEIEAILPEACATRPDGTKAVRYEQLVPLLIEGIKELKAEIEELKK
jgi:hypothetical protein